MYLWTPQNLPSSITSGEVTETYDYNADDERVKKTRSGTETYYVAGLYEEEQPTGGGSIKQRCYYTFNGQTVAQRETDFKPSDTVLTRFSMFVWIDQKAG